MAAQDFESGQPLDIDIDIDVASEAEAETETETEIETETEMNIGIDVRKLLSLAIKSEQSALHFGHPPTPQLDMYTFPELSISFITAKTPHYVCSQVIIDHDSRNTEPHVLIALNSEVTATCLVELEPMDTIRRILVLVGSESSTSETQSQAPSTFENVFHVAEVWISPTGLKRIPPWQPIPIRPGLFEPNAVTSIVSFQMNRTNYVWVSFDEGTLIQVPAESLAQSFTGEMDPKAVLKIQTLLPKSNAKAGPYKVVPWIGDPPTLIVYSAVFRSDDFKDVADNQEKSESELFNVALGATSTLYRTVSNVVRWGLTRQSSAAKATDMWDDGDSTVYRFPQVYEPATIQLTAAYELHDAPRQIVSLQIRDNYALITDNLGRVQLLHLENHFQVIRMWKGHRDAACVWSGKDVVIYSRQRRSLDVYPLPHGKRIASQQYIHDADIVQCTANTGEGSCYILEAVKEGAVQLLKRLILDKNHQQASLQLPSADAIKPTASDVSSLVSMSPSISMQSLEMDSTLQLLRQMLDDTHVQCNKDDVYRTFSKISNLNQLCTALDLLCVSSALEGRMGAQGSDFQEQCVNHARLVLEKAIDGKGADITQSPPVLEIQLKLTIHKQLIDAYRVLAYFEKRRSDETDDDAPTNLESSWAVEGIAWLQTYENVTNRSLSFIGDEMTPMSFSSFCRCCNISASTFNAKNGKLVVQLSDSSRTRMNLLSHIFEPLLQDTFSFKITNEIIDKMGFDMQACQIYLGNWFMSISASKAASKSFFMVQPPIARWIQQLVARQVDDYLAADEDLPGIILPELHTFCAGADDLVRAFWLATLCRDSISKVVKKREVKTYGKVWKTKAVAPWEQLLRKIRVCLLLSLRLHRIRLGAFPITVSNIEDGLFSLYELVARDELSTTSTHDEIILLEYSCKRSGFSFDPTSPLGDDPSRWKALQHACLASSLSEAERTEYLVEFESEVQGALLLYLRQFNEPFILCAHRALLLAQMWMDEPSRVEILRHCLDALIALRDDDTSAAVRYEVWHTCIRPAFRAFLFGFDDVQELQEDVFSSLFEVNEWLMRMGKIGLSILSLMERADSSEQHEPLHSNEIESCWPPASPDPVLRRLVEKERRVNQQSLRIHREIITGCLVSSDVSTLSECVGGFYHSFLSLHQPSISSDIDAIKQMDFLENAIICRAESMGVNVLDRFELDEIESLALLWGVDVRDVRTIFLLAMYEFGKDFVVSDLLSHVSSHRSIDWERFLDDGIGIVCRRLHLRLHVQRSREMRALLGMLDADTIGWIRTTAEGAARLLEDDEGDRAELEVPLQFTHLLVLRLMNIAAGNATKEIRAKLHSLSVLTGTMLNELDFDRF